MKNRTKKQTRTLTIQSDTRYGMSYKFKQVPRLRLTGLWLEQAGFRPGDKVTVEVKSGELILKPSE